MSGRQRVRRNNNNRTNQGTRGMIRAAQHRDAGKKLIPALRPPQIVRLPWNSYTFSATFATATSQTINITVGTIRNQIASLMGFTGSTGSVSIKVNSAYAWNTSIGPNFSQPSMEGLFWELSTDSGGTYSVRSEQYDHGTLNIPARVGYLYPLSDRKEVHTATNDSHLVARFVVPSSASGNGNVTIRVNVLWNSAAQPTQLNIADSMDLPQEQLE